MNILAFILKLFFKPMLNIADCLLVVTVWTMTNLGYTWEIIVVALLGLLISTTGDYYQEKLK